MIAFLIHFILMFPIFIRKRKLEAQENAINHLNQNRSKSLDSFFVNCISIGVFFIGTLNVSLIMNK